MPTVPPRLSSWAAAHGQPPTGEPLRIGRLPSTTSLSTKLSRRRPGAEHGEREPNHGGLVRYFLPDSRGILEHTIWYSGHWRQDMQCGFEPLRPASIIPLFRWLCCRRWKAKEGLAKGTSRSASLRNLPEGWRLLCCQLRWEAWCICVSVWLLGGD